MTGSGSTERSWRARGAAGAWRWHHRIGLLLALPLLGISLSGALLVRYDWVERVGDPRVFRGAPATNALPLHLLLARLADRFPEISPRFVERPGDPWRNVVVSLHGPEAGRTVIADAVTGEVLVDRDEGAGPRRWLLRLHDRLHAGVVGEWVVALSAAALLASAVTGLWIHRGALRSLRRLPRFRGIGVRQALREAHTWTGTVAAVFLALWGLTGMLLTWPSLPATWSPPVAAPPRPVPVDWHSTRPIEPMIAAACQALPGGEADFLVLPRTAAGEFSLTLLDRDRWWWCKFDEAVWHPGENALKPVRRGADASLPERVNALVAILHFGHLGHPLVRWMYLMAGFAPALLAVTGLAIWWRRRRRSTP
ncbi:MAG: PepSY domain-containing protein [Verrucomicrobia bacterium]|nr:PepSY domain-containing protein [Verrucomicrobiota bacterium]